MLESNGSIPSPENNPDANPQIGVYLGRIGTAKMVEIKGVTKLISPEGYVGLPASTIGKIAIHATPNSIVWIKIADSLSEHITPEEEQIMQFVNGELVLDSGELSLTINGTDTNLTSREFQVVSYLAKKKGKIIRREELIHSIWAGYVNSRTPDIHIYNIQKKLGDYSWIVRTKHGIGYILDDSPENAPLNSPSKLAKSPKQG